MRRVAALLLIGVAVAVPVAAAGCGGGGGSGPAPKPSPSPNPHAAASGEAVIRAWTKAVYDGDYGRAADLFAHGAIVQQGVTFVLTSRARAVAFNRSLPCRARVTGIEREPHGLLLASFELLPGRAGGCPDGGRARVRFMIRGGRIETWRQLPQAPGAPSQSV